MEELKFEDIREIVINYAKQKVEEIKKSKTEPKSFVGENFIKKVREIEVGITTSSPFPEAISKVSYILLKNEYGTIIQIDFPPTTGFSREHIKTYDEFLENLQKYLDKNCRIYSRGKLIKVDGDFNIYKNELGIFKVSWYLNVKNPELVGTSNFFPLWDNVIEWGIREVKVYRLSEAELLAEVI